MSRAGFSYQSSVEHSHTLANMWRHLRGPRERLERFRDRKLLFLVAHAYEHVPYYRRLFERAGVHPSDIRCVADLARLPISSKADLRERPADVVAQGVDAKRLILRYTAGSTGEPTRVRRTAREDYLLQMFRIRAHLILGRRVRDHQVELTSRGVPTDRKPASLTRLAKHLGMLRTTHLDCLRPIPDLALDVARLAPDVLAGFPGVLAEIAAVWPDIGRRKRNPRLLFVGGEVATPAMRAHIRTGFQAPVFGLYGSHEFNLLGWECAATGELHVCDDNVIIEIVHGDRAAQVGESGEVVVTGLHSYSVPYIRYRLGDIATMGNVTCRCGAPFSTLWKLSGRTMDYCVLPNGRKMHHWELIPMSFWEMPWHRRYQLLQETRERFALRVIATAEPPRADLDALSSQIRQTLGPGADFRIELVDDLAFAESGKHRLCVSLVADASSGEEPAAAPFPSDQPRQLHEDGPP